MSKDEFMSANEAAEKIAEVLERTAENITKGQMSAEATTALMLSSLVGVATHINRHLERIADALEAQNEKS